MVRARLPEAPRVAPLRVAALALAGILLTSLFVVHGFRYELLAPRISAFVAGSTPFELQIGALGPRFSLLVPGVEATQLRLTGPRGAELRIDRLRLRPAGSPGWLWLRPSFRIGLELGGGTVEGTLGAGPSFAGKIAGLDLEQLPLEAFWPGAALVGSLDASLDVRGGADGPGGSIELAMRKGSATLPTLPLPIAFESLTGRLALGVDALLRVEELRLAGPGLAAQLTGSLGRAASFGAVPLDLGVEIQVEPQLRAGVQALGLPLRPDGRGSFRIRGSMARPAIE